MTADPRAALSTLIAALERHLELAASRKDADDPAVGAAAEAVIEAFDDYDEALFDSTGVATPLGVYGEDDDEDEDEDDDDEDDEDDEDEDDEEEDERRGRGRGRDADEDDEDEVGDEDEEPAEPRGRADEAGVYAGLDDEDVDFEDDQDE